MDIWIVQDKETKIIYGAFGSEERANKYANGSNNVWILKIYVEL
jgi:hypothetical protein